MLSSRSGDLGRTLLGVPFIAQAFAYRQTEKHRVVIAKRLGVPAPEHATRADAAVKLAGGAMLVVGLAPRATALMLAANLVPTTIGTHQFWNEEDPMAKERVRQHFMLNCAVIGGLLAVAAAAHDERS